jgi:DNA-binding transcriptional LysR family regulator
VNVSIAGLYSTNNVETLTSAAKQGLGVTVGATMSVGPALLSGELVRVLSNYEFEPTAVFAVYASARQLSTKIRATVDFLTERLSDPPVWDQRLRGKVPGF